MILSISAWQHCAIMPTVDMLSHFSCSYAIMLSVVALNTVMLTVIKLTVSILNVVMLSIVVPFW
jgi:hypothetical protein